MNSVFWPEKENPPNLGKVFKICLVTKIYNFNSLYNMPMIKEHMIVSTDVK